MSRGEETFALHCRLELTHQPEREFKFHPTRGWRVDFAWPDRKLAVEIESSVHRIKNRFASDIPKYNALALGDWTLLRFTAKMVDSAEAIDTVKAFLAN
jgi:very-short-patch-repair endonuclease